jgi:hypothetical protein
MLNNMEPIKALSYLSPVLAISAWIYTLYLTADEQPAQAVVQALAAYSDSTRANYPQRSALLAVEAANVAEAGKQPIDPRTRRALIDSLYAVGGTPLTMAAQLKNTIIWPAEDMMNGVTFSPNARWLIEASEGVTAVRNLSAEAPFAAKGTFPGTLLESTVVAPNGGRLVTFKRFDSAPVYLWYQDCDGSFNSSELGAMKVNRALFSDDSRWVVTEVYNTISISE